MEDDWYTVEGAEILLHSDEKQLRKEYTRLRDIAEKRLKRLQKDYGWTKTGKKESFRKLKDIDRRDLPKALSELAKFVKAGTSTVSGQRKAQEKTTATLNKAVGSETAVNAKNYRRVIEVLNAARKLKNKVLYGSDKIVELAEATMVLSQDQFDVVLANLEAVLPHSDEFLGELTGYVAVRKSEDDDPIDLDDYASVDIDDFLEVTGWKVEDTEG